MRFDTWLTLSGSNLDLSAANAGPTPDADFGGKLGHPSNFVAARDPKGLFELRYPEGWVLDLGRMEVRSMRLPLSARVEVHPGPEISWDLLRRAIAGPDGLLLEEKRLPGPPSQVRAQRVETDGISENRALAYPWGSVVVLLTTRLGPLPHPRLAAYGRAVLAAIRREFSVPAPRALDTISARDR
jgi:hypothetical protein